MRPCCRSRQITAQRASIIARHYACRTTLSYSWAGDKQVPPQAGAWARHAVPLRCKRRGTLNIRLGLLACAPAAFPGCMWEHLLSGPSARHHFHPLSLGLRLPSPQPKVARRQQRRGSAGLLLQLLQHAQRRLRALDQLRMWEWQLGCRGLATFLRFFTLPLA